MEFFEVGGAVRDELLGVKSKDIDYTCVLEQADIDAYTAHNQFTPFEYMVFYLKGLGFKIFLETPEYLTARAQFPKGHKNAGITADFVLARKESDYTDGRRPDKVEPGTLMDDLRRRDFCMNAIAKDSEGNLIDPFNGVQDIKDGIIRAVGDPMDRIREDKLRLLRALRFSITKGFRIDDSLQFAIGFFGIDLVDISAERVREELTKMFNHDMVRSIEILNDFELIPVIRDCGINFQPTMKERIR